MASNPFFFTAVRTLPIKQKEEEEEEEEEEEQRKGGRQGQKRKAQILQR